MFRLCSLFCLFISFGLALLFGVSEFSVLNFGYVSSFALSDKTVLLASYMTLLIAVVLGVISSRRKEGKGILNILEALASVAIAVVAIFTIWYEHQRAVGTTALQLLVEMDKERPRNVRPCRCAAANLEESALKLLINRQITPIARVEKSIDACFSDKSKSELNELIVDGRLTPQGASEFAERLNDILTTDEHIAIATNYGLASEYLIARRLPQVLPLDKIIASKVDHIFGFNVYPEILKMDSGPTPPDILSLIHI